MRAPSPHLLQHVLLAVSSSLPLSLYVFSAQIRCESILPWTTSLVFVGRLFITVSISSIFMGLSGLLTSWFNFGRLAEPRYLSFFGACFSISLFISNCVNFGHPSLSLVGTRACQSCLSSKTSSYSPYFCVCCFLYFNFMRFCSTFYCSLLLTVMALLLKLLKDRDSKSSSTSLLRNQCHCDAQTRKNTAATKQEITGQCPWGAQSGKDSTKHL